MVIFLQIIIILLLHRKTGNLLGHLLVGLNYKRTINKMATDRVLSAEMNKQNKQ